MPHRRVQEREQVLSEIQREDLQTGKNDRSSGKSAVRQHILRIRIRGGSIESQKGKRKTEKQKKSSYGAQSGARLPTSTSISQVYDFQE